MATYDKKGFVKNNGYRLVRHDRTDLVGYLSHSLYHPVLSWRAQRNNRTNRRFYVENESCWSIDLQVALAMLNDAFDEKLFLCNDVVTTNAICEHKIVKPEDDEYERNIGGVLTDAAFDNEWQNSTAVICYQNSNQWKKVMLISYNKSKLTFRTLGIASDYRMYRRERSNDGFRLDASMIDAHPMAFEIWRKYLCETILKYC